MSLTDRFGDNGLIGVLLAKIEGDALVIDTWLMSCRVLETRRRDALVQPPLPLGSRPRAEANLRRVPSHSKERSGPRALCRTRIHQDLRRRRRADPWELRLIGRLAAAAGLDRGARISMSDVRAATQDVFRQVFDDPDIVLRDEMTADDIPGWDSLMHINLIVAAENGSRSSSLRPRSPG